MSGEIHLGVVGAGQMGTGFAVHFRLHGQTVTLVDHRQSNLDRARERIRGSVEFLNEQGVTSMSPEAVLDAVTFTLDTEAGVADADVVLETVSEDLEVKREVFRELADATSADTILATNTSSLQVSDIAAGFDFAHRVVGCHWLYPPYLLPTVEVIAGDETDDEVVEELVALLEAVDRKPIVVHRDVPGFVWNRVQFAVLRECMHLVDTGVASIEDVNTAIRDGYARRTAVLGPFETVDLAGLDLFRTVASGIYPSLSDRDTPSPMYDDRIEAGETGVESGAGFFEYDRSADEVAQRRDERLAALRAILGENDENGA
ncbi:MAG: 3-hydroxyacyl-CoA dehydrogenase family protein [Halosimplex sp.]